MEVSAVALGFDPFRNLDRLTEQMLGDVTGVRSVARAIPMDLYRSGDHYVLHCELAGMDPGSLNINVEGSTLTIEARRDARTDEDVQWLARERLTGAFRRQLTLGDDVDSDKIEASYDNGVVTLTIPVREQAKPRRIQIGATGSERALEDKASRES
jgi:HSP20 family protein